MRIDSSLLERKSQQPQKQQQQQLRELPKEKSRGKKNRRRNKKQMTPSVIQNLFDTCKEVFAGAGTIPSPVDVERLRSVLDSMSPEDVGLSQDMPYFSTTETEGAPLITYLHLYECDMFSMGIFCLPPSGVIPLHNHPGMTVFSKLLFGSMHIKAYDWADIPHSSDAIINPSHFQPSNVRLAKVKIDTVFTAPCNTSILYPAAGGNMHCFTAMTACAVLDVLGPPYSDSEGRHCTYYNSFPYASFSDAV
ncbi:plant cysteine oxidase 2 isoform X2 [Magnolia sinica]|uniref:plant cysteine oxidase 2 isoform X2 n=1 Tax=Magnolia sinica TaxID=86752 RepID=UPI002659476F|nr:plant cysteine oxidase 2 isoform X2 [Magnolia sinica]